MRSSKVFAVLLAAFSFIGSTAYGAINFSQAGSELPVSPNPDVMLRADMNLDGLDDAIVISTRSDEVSVILADPAQANRFRLVGVDSFGSTLRVGDVGDLTRDGRPDLAVPDQRANGVWVLTGNGEGDLSSPSFFSVGRNPYALTIANFDGARGNDIAITDDSADVVSILLNDGNVPPRFTRGPVFQVGEKPRSIVTLDVNDDGELDIVTLNTGGPRVKSISVLIFDGVRSGLPVFLPARNLGVGENPTALNAADLNNDGRTDLVMLNRSLLANGISEFNIMLNRGDGSFDGPNRLAIPCPFFVGRDLCRAHALAVGDFNNTGTIDLAVFLTDPRTSGSGSGVDQDALLIYSGRGDGQFEDGPSLATPKSAESAISLDLNGDALIDLVAGFQRRSNVTAFINISTPGQVPNGEECTVGGVCLSGICIEGFCCATACEPDETCALPNAEGICRRIPPTIQGCDVDDDCVDYPEPGSPGFCQRGFCCENRCDNGRCDVEFFEGLCVPIFERGEVCDDRFDCRSDNCANNRCCNEPCDNGFCGNDLGICEELTELGDPCQVDGQCDSGICDRFLGICCGDFCEDDEECNPDGICVPTTTDPVREPGESCGTDDQCTTGHCLENVCCVTASCDEGEFCLPPNGVCAVPPTATPTPIPREPGSPCDDGRQCISGNCVDFVCCVEVSCLADEFCSAEVDGECVEGTPPPTPTPTPVEVCRGFPCGRDQRCIDEGGAKCVDECDDGLCEVGEACVSTSTGGGRVCVDACINFPCDAGSQCVIGNNGRAVCAIPCGSQTFCEPGEVCEEQAIGEPLCIRSSRSGGCAVTQGRSLADLWVLALLPVALLALRRRELLRRKPVRVTRK